MTKVLVLSTGGTIASRAQDDGAARAVDTGEQLVARAGVGAGIEVVTRNIFLANSFTVGPAQMLDLVREVHRFLRDPELDGVVITHGTDTLEESAFLLDLVHDDDRPVVLTGAQLPADASDSDGPRNLADAIAVATDPAARRLGALIVVDGAVYPAFGTRKVNTLHFAAFASPDNGPLGGVVGGALTLRRRPVRSAPLSLEAMDLTGIRVDIAAFYPGCDAVVLEAAAEAGARGIVLQGTGAGNANSSVVDKVAELTGAGIVVGLTTRVDSGPVAALYGNGGGVDLVRAGAVPMGILRAPQARMLLMAALATESDPARVRDVLATFI
ncbi:L-asparaginase/glutRNAGln amidotransferase subunit D [Mycobacterium tuberculosis]|nr:L-asparaginase/glutRNAGln amidotransferase subunit D [Mycobacterium tuberculosis]